MRGYILGFVLTALSVQAHAQFLEKAFKYATFYTAVGGGNSLAAQEVFSVTGGLQTTIIKTPFDYSLTAGVRKIARFGYENKATAFYDGTEKGYGDAATLGKRNGFEFLFEVDYRRQQGKQFVDQTHFLRYASKWWLAKVAYVQDGFADISYSEASQRLRLQLSKAPKGQFSLNAGIAQRISEPYGYDPLAEWVQQNNSIHYTALALEQGYSVDFSTNEFLNPEGEVVAASSEVWSEVVIPEVLQDYVSEKRGELPAVWCYSAVVGFDYYQNSKSFWLHTWANVFPYHLKAQSEYAYNNFIGEEQWVDYSAGFVSGWRMTKNLGVFVEGRYSRYWNRTWHDFSAGINYVII